MNGVHWGVCRLRIYCKTTNLCVKLKRERVSGRGIVYLTDCELRIRCSWG